MGTGLEKERERERERGGGDHYYCDQTSSKSFVENLHLTFDQHPVYLNVALREL